MRKIIANIKVYLAYLSNNKNGKSVDVHGRRYSDVYKKFGHSVMVNEYLKTNTWFIK